MKEEDLEAIADVLDKEILFRKTKDVAGMLSLFTEDAVFIPPNEDPIKGRKALKRVFENWFSTFEDMELKTLIVDVTGMGDVAAVWYAIVLRTKRKGQEATETRGRGIVIFKRTRDGWKMHWDIWNPPSN
jgi:uncharacterized protein (TIGR02246 family)